MIDADLKFEYIRGQGPGGQHRNRRNSCVRVTHIPTGISVIEDGRDQHRNKKVALRKLEKRLAAEKEKTRAKAKKARRDEKIHNSSIIRTYDYSRGIVTDHRTGKTGTIKNIIIKGRIDLLC